jgi:hypothetical protein
MSSLVDWAKRWLGEIWQSESKGYSYGGPVPTEAQKSVFLVKDNEFQLSMSVNDSECGLVATLYNHVPLGAASVNCRVILLPGGKTKGCASVSSWMPHGGWFVEGQQPHHILDDWCRVNKEWVTPSANEGKYENGCS